MGKGFKPAFEATPIDQDNPDGVSLQSMTTPPEVFEAFAKHIGPGGRRTVRVKAWRKSDEDGTVRLGSAAAEEIVWADFNKVVEAFR